MESANAWGFCRACDRWFRCPGWSDEVGSGPRCPFCRSEPSTVVVRGEREDEQPHTRIEGQCPRCHEWFEAEDWFDSDKPVPICPECGLVPCRLAYVDVVGHRTERVLAIDLVGTEQWLG